jgi:hypothetical protein
LLFISCNLFEKQEPDGGPCTYDTRIYPMKVIKIEQVKWDSTHFDLEFERNRNQLKDTISYSTITKAWLTKEELNKENIAIGNIVQWEEKTILTGHCNPMIGILILKNYK